METIFEDRCTITIAKKGPKIIVTSTKGFRWVSNLRHPEYVMADVLTHTMVEFFKRQECLRDRFIITLNVQKQNDE